MSSHLRWLNFGSQAKTGKNEKDPKRTKIWKSKNRKREETAFKAFSEILAKGNPTFNEWPLQRARVSYQIDPVGSHDMGLILPIEALILL